MHYSDLTEVKAYLDHIRSDPDLETLVDVEIEQFSQVGRDPENSDWHDFPGTEHLQSLWEGAAEPRRQAQLGKVAHLRAKAWGAVFSEIFSRDEDEGHEPPRLFNVVPPNRL